MKPNITIAIPAYNSEKTIRAAIESALMQEYPLKEILVSDDGSTDETISIADSMGVRVVTNVRNLGIGRNLVKCMDKARGKYIIYLCADDVFTSPKVVGDVVKIFNENSKIGVINRYYYQFLDGKEGAVMTVRDDNIFTSVCNPSGVALRRMDVTHTDRIFIEMPHIVRQYLEMFEWTTMEWDTVAVRLHPSGNTGCKPSYYKESPIQVWTDFLGKDFKYHLGLIQLKNRCPSILWREICLTVKINPKNLLDGSFVLLSLIALITPSWLLRRISDFYRNRISRLNCQIIRRPNE